MDGVERVRARNARREHKTVVQEDGTTIETRECNICMKWLSLEKFGKCKQDTEHGLNYMCKTCNNAKAKRIREETKRKIEAGEQPESKESKPRPEMKKKHTTCGGVEGKD